MAIASTIAATLGAFLLQIIGTLAARVLISLGIALMATKGGELAFDTVMNYFNRSKASIPADMLQLMSLYGFNTAMSWILGAISFMFTMKTANKAIRFVSSKK